MPAPLAIRLSSSEKSFLKRLGKETCQPRTWARAVCLLMLAAGDPVSKVAGLLSVSLNTVTRWKQRWLRRGRRGLADGRRCGRPPKATPSYLAELLRVARRNPRKMGYAFSRWTAPRLSQYLALKTRIRFCPQWITELLRRRDIVWRRTKRTIRNLQNPGELKRSRLELNRLKRGRSSPGRTTNSGSPMASDSNCFRS